MHGFYFYKDYGTENRQNNHAYRKDGVAIHCVDLQEVSTNNQKTMYKILILFRPDIELKDIEINEELLIGIDNKELDSAYFFKEFKTIGELQAYAGGVMDALGWKGARYITKSSRISNIMNAYEKKKAAK